jgi:two-component system NarL family response regulator
MLHPEEDQPANRSQKSTFKPVDSDQFHIGTRTAEAADGQEAVELWIKHRPDVTLLDLRMPKLDGVGVIERIRGQDASARVIVLTTYETDTEILRAIKAGTKAYLSKDTRREELLDCIRRVNRGETCIPASLVEKVAAGLSSESLTGRELNVLELLARGKATRRSA